MSIANESPATQGFGNFLSVASLLSNASALEAEYKKLSDAQAKAQAVIDLVGPAQDILRMRESIDAEQTAATQALVDAKQEAAELVKEARARAVAIVSGAEKAAAALNAEAEQSVVDAKALFAKAQLKVQEAEARNRAVTDAMTAASMRERVAADAKTRAEAAQMDLLAERARLQDVAAQIASMVDEALNVHRAD